MRIRNVVFPSHIRGRVKKSHLLDHDYLAQAPDTEATIVLFYLSGFLQTLIQDHSGQHVLAVTTGSQLIGQRYVLTTSGNMTLTDLETK